MRIAIPKESTPGENRVALVPTAVNKLVELGIEVTIQFGVGNGALISDDAYKKAGATVSPDISSLYNSADVILKVQGPRLDKDLEQHEADLIPKGATVIAFLQPLSNPK